MTVWREAHILHVAFGQRQQQWWMWVCSNRCPYTILGVEFEFTQELRLDNQTLKTLCILCQRLKDKKRSFSIILISSVQSSNCSCRPVAAPAKAACALWQNELHLTLTVSFFFWKERELQRYSYMHQQHSAVAARNKPLDFPTHNTATLWMLLHAPF